VKRIAALVPMRHESERVPGKNYRHFAGRPLYHRIVETLLASPSVSSVVIDTDSPLITQDATSAFPEVQVIDRPHALRGGNVPMNDVLMHDVEQVDADLFLQTHSTNPLLTSGSIERAVAALLDSAPEHDSLFSVTSLQSRLWWPDGRPLNHDPAILLRTQDLPPVYEENSCIYLFSAETLRRTRTRLGSNPLMFPIPALEAVDIDDELDFMVAEQLFAIHRGSRA